MEEQGTLNVQVTTSRAQLPVEGATVVITTPVEGGKHDLVFVAHTDESGRSGPILLRTPLTADGGQTPGGGTPFSMYSLWVEHPEYMLAFIENFQVFPGVESIQQISLVPLSSRSGGYSDINDSGNVTPQPL